MSATWTPERVPRGGRAYVSANHSHPKCQIGRWPVQSRYIGTLQSNRSASASGRGSLMFNPPAGSTWRSYYIWTDIFFGDVGLGTMNQVLKHIRAVGTLSIRLQGCRIILFCVLGFGDKNTGICAGAMPHRQDFRATTRI